MVNNYLKLLKEMPLFESKEIEEEAIERINYYFLNNERDENRARLEYNGLVKEEYQILLFKVIKIIQSVALLHAGAIFVEDPVEFKLFEAEIKTLIETEDEINDAIKSRLLLELNPEIISDIEGLDESAKNRAVQRIVSFLNSIKNS